MQDLDQRLEPLMNKYLLDISENWQPTDLLPDPTADDFMETLREIQGLSKEMSYTFWVVLIADTITEEALPTYESWLMCTEGIDQLGPNNWSRWIRGWTAEENRHGDLLNKYLYLSGAVNMREMEVSTQYLIADGFDLGIAHDPYKNFVYTSFQELATNVSHRRTATLAKKSGNGQLAKICGRIASDEMRHANAYSHFMKLIFEMDASEAMIAFNDMMRKGITMPAHFLRESGEPQGEAFVHFSHCAQSLGVYTAHDYVDIYNGLINDWDIANLNGLTSEAEKAREELMKRPMLLKRLAERQLKPVEPRRFSWVNQELAYF